MQADTLICKELALNVPLGHGFGLLVNLRGFIPSESQATEAAGLRVMCARISFDNAAQADVDADQRVQS